MKRTKNILNKTNNCQLKYSVRNYRSVEKQNTSYMSRGLPTVFHVIDSAPREWLGGDNVCY
ncbi:MAG: hypothetical protein LBC68_07855 [Prevotellaceae bacterium]|nr:hypothetical protein [Prevotellaceae bacterium]